MNSLLLQAATLCLPEETDKNYEVDFHFMAPREMAEINLEHVGHEGITDVICFNYPEGMSVPGEESVSRIEIFVCPEAAAKASGKYGRTYEGELILYTVHGLLHASGENDIEPEDRKVMRRKERSVIAKLKKLYDFDKIFEREKHYI